MSSDALHDALASAKDHAETPERLAHSMDAVADWLTRWLATMPAQERALFEQMGFHAAAVSSLRAGAQRIRDTQGDLDALGDDTHVTQRQLDEQDGRVLHLVGTVWTAFACAAREDDGVVLPDLDALATVFDRRRGTSAGEGDGAPKDPPAPPR